MNVLTCNLKTAEKFKTITAFNTSESCCILFKGDWAKWMLGWQGSSDSNPQLHNSIKSTKQNNIFVSEMLYTLLNKDTLKNIYVTITFYVPLKKYPQQSRVSTSKCNV